MADRHHTIFDMQETLVKTLCMYQFLSNRLTCIRKVKKWNISFSLVMILLLVMYLSVIRDF